MRKVRPVGKWADWQGPLRKIDMGNIGRDKDSFRNFKSIKKNKIIYRK